VLFVVGVSVAWRLVTLYLGRLDAKQANDPEAERRAIAASRRRAQGHLWLLGVLMTSLFVLGLLFGVEHPPVDPKRLLLVGGLAIADAFCFHKMVAAYGDARRIRTAASG
jgi:hypothetical protein